MNTIKLPILVAAIVAVVFGVSGGTAQEGRTRSGESTLGDLGLRVRQENLDSYWLENRTWAEYGYRPHAMTHQTRFTSLPSPYAGRNYYAWGDQPQAHRIYESVGRPYKEDVQLSKYGLWH